MIITMINNIITIVDVFQSKINREKNRFDYHLSVAAKYATQIDPINGVNELAIQLFKENKSTWSLIKFKKLIDLGADPIYSNNKLFDLVISDLHYLPILFYLVENFGFSLENVKINIAFKDTNPDEIKQLLAYGYDFNEIIQEIFYNGKNILKTDMMIFIVDQAIDRWPFKLSSPELATKILLVLSHYKSITIYHIQKLIDFGADPRTNEDEIINIAICISNKIITEYLIYNFICDSKNQNPIILEEAIGADFEEVVKYLLNLGYQITDRTILNALYNPKYLNILFDYGLFVSKALEVYHEYISITEASKIIIERGGDFNDICLMGKNDML